MTCMHTKTSTGPTGVSRSATGVSAFTLAELLVVVAIIALLITALVPALQGVRRQAKAVATKTLISTLTTGLESYKTESALGGTFPPSKSDAPPSGDLPSDVIQSPFSTTELDLEHTTGASLLVYALNGADGLGTPGFPDLNADTDGKWSDDTSAKNTGTPYGAYGIAPVGAPNAGEPLVPRYGPYANSDPVLKSIKTIRELMIDKNVFYPPSDNWTTGADSVHKVFTDSWSVPILYYKARRGARAMIPPKDKSMPGIYDPYDNLAITGSSLDSLEGLHPVQAGGALSGKVHPLGNFKGVLKPDTPDFMAELESAGYARTFERYIWDKTVTARPTPVNLDTYLLISAGPDGLYGTADDVTNFEKK